MKRILVALLAATALTARAENESRPLRVAVLDFADQTGQKSDAKLGGAIAPGALADKGFLILGKHLLQAGGFDVIDRRDFVNQIEKLVPTDMGLPTPTKPSFIQAAQQLRADAVLRGSILSFSTGKERVNLGGHATEFSTVSLRVALEALDAKDGKVIAVSDGASNRRFRQTEAVSTEMSEDDVLAMLEDATAQAVGVVQAELQKKEAELAARPTVTLAVKTTEDPALVEVDGILIGTAPLEGFEVYKGDHVLTITKPGYVAITKRVLFEKNTSIEVPMLRESLTAEERKEILQKANIDIINSDLPGLIIKTTD